MNKAKRLKHSKHNPRVPVAEPVCGRCGKSGLHFVPPSFGEEGFYICEVSDDKRT